MDVFGLEPIQATIVIAFVGVGPQLGKSLIEYGGVK